MAAALSSTARHQLATLVLCHVRTGRAASFARAAAWHNWLLRLGVELPLFFLHDLGQLWALAPSERRWAGAEVAARLRFIGEREHLWPASPRPRSPAETATLRRQLAQLLELGPRYQALLESLQGSEVVGKTAALRLHDELLAGLLGRLLGELSQRWAERTAARLLAAQREGGAAAEPARTTGGSDLPLDPTAYPAADAAQATDLDLSAAVDFLSFVTSDGQPWHLATCVEQVDLATLRLLSLNGQQGAAGAPQGADAADLLDLHGVLWAPEARDIAQFSLDLLPALLETRRASGVQRYPSGGYASVERHGTLDALLLSELLVDDELFLAKLVEGDFYYYGHEAERAEEQRLHHILIDASPSMRGRREVFARGLALGLAKKLGLLGSPVCLRFFDGRLHERWQVERAAELSRVIPQLLGFRSQRGRNYARVFQALHSELAPQKYQPGQKPVLYIITHGQCHIPLPLMQALAQLAVLYGVFILPSGELRLDYLPLLTRCQVVSDASLGAPEERKARALHIIADATAAPTSQ